MKKSLKGLLAVVFALMFALLNAGALSETWDERILGAADTLTEDGIYTDLDHVAAYLVFYGELPANYITKTEAKALGWSADQDLWSYAEGYSLGGDAFGNREGLLPPDEYHECDLYYTGGARGDERLVYSDAAIYYTGDRYASFTLVYPSEDEALIENAPKPTPSPSPTPKRTASPTPKATATPAPTLSVEKNGTYTDKEHVALYIHLYGKLPSNYITKSEAQRLGWDSRTYTLDRAAPGKSIGGDRFGNYEGQLPGGVSYKECDIDYTGGYRNAKRIIYGSDGSVYYTEDHYETFERLY